ncbi:MAG TPA: hypothetical protein VN688_22095 [Gemmataceae bacterium]|nr:hypothetical protein [Gemmataceae bacterium]
MRLPPKIGRPSSDRSFFENSEGSSLVGSQEAAVQALGGGIRPAEFKHCCGNDQYKMMCEKGSVRCYEKQAGQWKYTYGHICKESIPDCYNSVNANSQCCK